jgi:hypothetical protein
MLLKYLGKHTAMNKTIFGGDFCNTYEYPDTGKTMDDWMSIMRSWKLAIRDIPNHHSVVGNHDKDVTAISTDKALYGFLFAPEETNDIVRGGDFYYYIDDPNEKTRYIYLNTGLGTFDDAQCDFTIEALKTLPNDWHIIAISHIWFVYDSTDTPTVGSVPANTQKLLALLDAYNARNSGNVTITQSHAYNFTDCGGWVEFCIGGHTHVDYNFTSERGIPIILCCTDSKHLRGDYEYKEGTTTEAAVSGIIADYDAKKIKVIRVGRGQSYDVAINRAEPISYTNALKAAIGTDGQPFNGGLGYKEKCRLSEGNETGASFFDTTGYIAANRGDIIRLRNVTFCETQYQKSCVACYDANFTYLQASPTFPTPGAMSDAWAVVASDDGTDVVQFTIPTSYNASTCYIRIVCSDLNENSIITVNEEIE